MLEEEELLAVLELFCPEPSNPPTDWNDEGSVEDALANIPVETVFSTDPDGQLQRLLAAFPTADPKVVYHLVEQCPVEYVDALLSPELSTRGKYVAQVILERGSVTCEIISKEYQEYRRAIKDLRDVGVTLSKPGQEYYFDPQSFVEAKESRNPLSTQEIQALLKKHPRCTICHQGGHLQGDHRVPWDIVGNQRYKLEGIQAFMALCPSCNTKKRDVCKPCPKTMPCNDCYWAYPEKYTHIACLVMVRFELTAPEGTPSAKFIQAIKKKATELGF